MEQPLQPNPFPPGMAIDLRKFIQELFNFRQHLPYDKDYIKTTCDLIAINSRVNHFVFSLNAFMIYSGFLCDQQTNVYEFEKLHKDSGEKIKPIINTKLEEQLFNKCIETDASMPNENIMEAFKSKFDELFGMIKLIPTENLDEALTVLMKKTYALDMKIRNRLYSENEVVKKRMDDLKTNQVKISEKEKVRKTIQLFLGKK